MLNRLIKTTPRKMAGRTFQINFAGDVMLGRLVDQLLPTHVDEPSEANHIRSFAARNPQLQNYSHASPWGSVLPLLREADLNVINLETSVTSSGEKWPDKAFNYRMHPDNLQCLKIAGIDYAGLANNHTLDFSLKGLEDTVRFVREAGIAGAGAGLNNEEALRPATLHLPNPTKKASSDTLTDESKPIFAVKIWSGSDHPSEWSKIPSFHLIDYSNGTRNRIRTMLSASKTNDRSDGPRPLKIFSVHWGPNYSWEPAGKIQALAHFLVDECGVDIVHGHSSHHIQGVEVYNRSLIIYGCGDLVDDYALVPEYRNDLSAIWRVHLRECDSTETGYPRLAIDGLEVIPTRCSQFAVHPLKKDDKDWQWFKSKFSSLCSSMRTTVTDEGAHFWIRMND